MHSNIAAKIMATFTKNPHKVFLKSYEGKSSYDGNKATACINKISLSLLAEGCNAHDKIAIYAQNCPEWSMVDIGCMQAQLISVPLYATNNAKEVSYILQDSSAHVVFVGEQEQYNEMLKIENAVDYRIIVFDDNVTLTTDNSIHFSTWLNLHDVHDHEIELNHRKENIKLEDLATLIYTSGTTGKPKGVQLQHLQFISTIENHNQVYDFRSEYTSLAFLPLSHVFERGWTYIVLANGMTNVYLRDPKVIAEALLAVKPNTFCAVPRLYEKIYAKIQDNIANESGVKQKIFHWAVEQGKKKVMLEQAGKKMGVALKLKNNLAEKLVFSKIRENLGGNLEMCPCGGAYIPDNLVLFFKAIGVPMLVGYGLTETVATVTSFLPDVYKVGTVGKPLINVDVKIGENQEILVKADSVTPGYYNLEEENKTHFTSDGWFKTGDAGHFDEDGFLVITDRIKELIKTANGKYIAPQLVEGNLNQSPFISQSMLVGEGKSYACALLTLDPEFCQHWAQKQNIAYDNLEDLANNEKLWKAVEKSVAQEQSNLSSHEKAKKFSLLAHEFTMEKNQLTPTLKLKRKIILDQFKNEILAMYGEG